MMLVIQLKTQGIGQMLAWDLLILITFKSFFLIKLSGAIFVVNIFL